MSGIEILGVAAGVLQIAELGGKLSVKLFTFTRKIKNADKQIDSISQDIAATGAVLQQLGSELKKDEQIRLCSPEAIAEARNLMQACRGVFDELNDAIDGNGKAKGAGKWLSLKRGINYTFVEDQILLLKAKLEHLKSSLLVMLNVLIFAGQLKGNEALPVLQDQRELLKQLVEEKLQNQRQFDVLLKRLDQMTVATADDSSVSPRDREASGAVSSSSITVVSTNPSIACIGPKHENKNATLHLPMRLHDQAEEIFDHCRLVKTLIEEINHVQYKLDLGIKYRAQQKILESHYHEWEKHWAEHEAHEPHHVRYRYFEEVPSIKRYWTEQASRKSAPSQNGAENAFFFPQTDFATNDPQAQRECQMQLMLLEQWNKKRLMIARQEQDNYEPKRLQSGNDALQDYQGMQLNLLRQRQMQAQTAMQQEQRQQQQQRQPMAMPQSKPPEMAKSNTPFHPHFLSHPRGNATIESDPNNFRTDASPFRNGREDSGHLMFYGPQAQSEQVPNSSEQGPDANPMTPTPPTALVSMPQQVKDMQQQQMTHQHAFAEMNHMVPQVARQRMQQQKMMQMVAPGYAPQQQKAYSLTAAEDNKAILVRAAEMARSTPEEAMEVIVAKMNPQFCDILRANGLEPSIYYFRELAKKEFYNNNKEKMKKQQLVNMQQKMAETDTLPIEASDLDLEMAEDPPSPLAPHGDSMEPSLGEERMAASGRSRRKARTQPSQSDFVNVGGPESSDSERVNQTLKNALDTLNESRDQVVAQRYRLAGQEQTGPPLSNAPPVTNKRSRGSGNDYGGQVRERTVVLPASAGSKGSVDDFGDDGLWGEGWSIPDGMNSVGEGRSPSGKRRSDEEEDEQGRPEAPVAKRTKRPIANFGADPMWAQPEIAIFGGGEMGNESKMEQKERVLGGDNREAEKDQGANMDVAVDVDALVLLYTTLKMDEIRAVA